MAVAALADGARLPPSLGRTSRAAVLTGLGLLLVTSLAGVGYLVVRGRPAEVPLHADTVVVGAGGQVVEARAAEVVPGTRVLAGRRTLSGWSPKSAPGWRPAPSPRPRGCRGTWSSPACSTCAC